MKDTDLLDTLAEVLRREGHVTVPASGISMGPAFAAAEALTIAASCDPIPRLGSIVVYRRFDRWVAHRVIGRFNGRGQAHIILTKGDGNRQADYPCVPLDDVVGVVVNVMAGGIRRDLTSFRARAEGRLKAVAGLVIAACWHVFFRPTSLRG